MAKRSTVPTPRETVVPANAGTHNHRALLFGQSRPKACLNHTRRGVWVPAFAGTTMERAASFPRRVFARVMQARRPSLDERAQGKPGAECTRSLGGNKKSPP